jgi:hypothetical protein
MLMHTFGHPDLGGAYGGDKARLIRRLTRYAPEKDSSVSTVPRRAGVYDTVVPLCQSVSLSTGLGGYPSGDPPGVLRFFRKGARRGCG